MKIEQGVTCLELAKKLKEAGYPQEGIWVWEYCEAIVSNQGGEYESWRLTGDDRWQLKSVRYCQCLDSYRDNKNDFIAPTVAELGEKLPSMIDNYILKISKRTITDQRCKPSKTKTDWSVIYEHLNRTESNMCEVYAPTEIDARAKMWLYLREKGLL